MFVLYFLFVLFFAVVCCIDPNSGSQEAPIHSCDEWQSMKFVKKESLRRTYLDCAKFMFRQSAWVTEENWKWKEEWKKTPSKPQLPSIHRCSRKKKLIYDTGSWPLEIVRSWTNCVLNSILSLFCVKNKPKKRELNKEQRVKCRSPLASRYDIN